ncbi:Translocator [Neolecta irregularis DAH-3]|uniref:Translocator n=1 Tax=Neolecta irregularis (strain DAH-3) TaxID=1198029 RepID=A0A1U7LPF7_NEOID|nr:Translocator [Neolecta irregularis DAH-3]|eukprot:OLL24534.1 Translocator [Neolecta irregularis DAH-3]
MCFKVLSTNEIYNDVDLTSPSFQFMAMLPLAAYILSQPALSILLPVGSGLAVGYLTKPYVREIYVKERFPPGKLPAWVFGPVWTGLYVAMGYASHLFYATALAIRSPLLVAGTTAYFSSLVLNLAYMPLTFGINSPTAGLVDLLLLLGNVLYITNTFSKVEKKAAGLMIPYTAWLCYASYLNAGQVYYRRRKTIKGKSKET